MEIKKEVGHVMVVWFVAIGLIAWYLDFLILLMGGISYIWPLFSIMASICTLLLFNQLMNLDVEVVPKEE